MRKPRMREAQRIGARIKRCKAENSTENSGTENSSSENEHDEISKKRGMLYVVERLKKLQAAG